MSGAAIRKIIHVDMDAFYASVEQRDDPGLRGRPVAVGHAARRGVVAAASYEARAFGVRSAMPSVTARRLCPDLVFAPPRFGVYRDVSRQVRAILEQYTPLVEPLSLDEAYLDVTANLRALPSASATATEIRARIRAETGLTASAGISYNKFLAKLASDHRKPNGQFVVTPDRARDFLATLPVAKFHGVGPVTAARLNRLGITTGAELARQPLELLEREFGKMGRWFFAIARGEDGREVLPDRPRKSSGAETTFAEDLTDPARIEAGLAAMADEVWGWCARSESLGRTATVKIKYADFRLVTRSRTLATPIDSRALLGATALDLLRSVYPLRTGIRLVGVTLSGFASGDTGTAQLDLDLGGGADGEAARAAG